MMVRAFVITDMECCQSCPGSMGSTAVSALLLAHETGPRVLYTSNVGDRYHLLLLLSYAVAYCGTHGTWRNVTIVIVVARGSRAVISHNGRALRLTTVHDH